MNKLYFFFFACLQWWKIGSCLVLMSKQHTSWTLRIKINNDIDVGVGPLYVRGPNHDLFCNRGGLNHDLCCNRGMEVNKTIKQYLKATIHDHPQSWVEVLLWAELWYNTYHHNLGSTPFQAIYSQPPPELIDYCAGNSNVEAVEVPLCQQDKLLWTLCSNLQAAQDCMKKYPNKRRHEFEF